MPPRRTNALKKKTATISSAESEAEAPTPKRRTSASAKRKVRTRHKSDDVEESENSSELDSDALDESDNDRKKKKHKKNTSTSTPKRARRKIKQDRDEDELELEEGQEVVGRVVKAPTTGLVPAGQISRNTLNFLKMLQDPECNDRQWFKLHEPVYRVAEKEWKVFIEAFTNVLIEVDQEIPPLPPKDLINRIYRDQRQNPLQEGPFRKFLKKRKKRHIRWISCVSNSYILPNFQRFGSPTHDILAISRAVTPGNESIIAAGTWCPGKNELQTLRTNIKRDPTRLRQTISAPDFVRYFGEPKPHPEGERQNIFGMDGELKTAPKGVAKDHKDIDLLKCRSFAVSHRFTDSEVLEPDFRHKVGIVARVMQPFVHCLNDLMTIAPDDGDDDEEEGEDGEEDDA